jgi:phenylglyoxylate dehydrogenase epsilon subunit
MIGCGSAAVSALKEIRALRSQDEVTLLTMEAHQPYSPMSLPYLIAGRKSRVPDLVRPGFLEAMGATLLTGSRVGRLDAGAKQVFLSDGRTESYDRLLIASGSEPILDPLLESAGVPTFHVKDDCGSLLALQGSSRVTVLGAGFVGMELAASLSEAGHEVEVIAPRERILRPYFDPAVDSFMIRLFQDRGIHIGLNCGEAREVQRPGGRFRVRFASGKEIDTDLLIAATGVRPRTDFLKGSGVRIDRGVVVDRNMMTNVADVYAAGDVAQTPNLLTGEYGLSLILPSAVEQGRVAGNRMADGDRRYEGWLSMNAFNFFGCMAVSLGRFMGGPHDEVLEDRDTEARRYKKLVFRDGRLIGANFFNVKVDTGVIAHLIRTGTDVRGNEGLLLEKPVDAGLWLMQEAERRETLSMER